MTDPSNPDEINVWKPAKLKKLDMTLFTPEDPPGAFTLPKIQPERLEEAVVRTAAMFKGEPLNEEVHTRGQIKDEPGWKYDAGKLRIDLFPPEALWGISHVLTFGAKKYGDRNWEKGMSWSRCFGAMMRHMWAWWRGEDLDPETRMSHLWHAGCCLAFLITYETRRRGTDDRPKE